MEHPSPGREITPQDLSKSFSPAPTKLRATSTRTQSHICLRDKAGRSDPSPPLQEQRNAVGRGKALRQPHPASGLLLIRKPCCGQASLCVRHSSLLLASTKKGVFQVYLQGNLQRGGAFPSERVPYAAGDACAGLLLPRRTEAALFCGAAGGHVSRKRPGCRLPLRRLEEARRRPGGGGAARSRGTRPAQPCARPPVQGAPGLATAGWP